ncbi:hypothetical protein F2Q68_00041785 [Brassica cretica]|uniref:Uncharacterized protein n=1 Tax=Brassica cretica TaxID=69181 RepID=A0A8S9MT36_BRACR|nr:hypothetical protein F2Q68_00041785 [Brassica cretica]
MKYSGPDFAGVGIASWFDPEMYVSFGGLLMLLRGDPAHISHFELDQRLFLLMRKL